MSRTLIALVSPISFMALTVRSGKDWPVKDMWFELEFSVSFAWTRAEGALYAVGKRVCFRATFSRALCSSPWAAQSYGGVGIQRETSPGNLRGFQGCLHPKGGWSRGITSDRTQRDSEASGGRGPSGRGQGGATPQGRCLNAGPSHPGPQGFGRSSWCGARPGRRRTGGIGAWRTLKWEESQA